MRFSGGYSVCSHDGLNPIWLLRKSIISLSYLSDVIQATDVRESYTLFATHIRNDEWMDGTFMQAGTHLLAPATARPQTLAVVAQTVELVVAQTVDQVDEKLLAGGAGEAAGVEEGDIGVESVRVSTRRDAGLWSRWSLNRG